MPEEKVPPEEKPSFEQIVLEHGSFIRRTLMQMGVRSRDVGDVEQEVFRGVSRGLPTFDPSLCTHPGSAVRGWLFGICERQAANHRRNAARRAEVLVATEDLDASESATPDSEQRYDSEERKLILLRLLDTLEPQRRAVVVAYELEGVPMVDIARSFGIPVNTAWNRLRLAREDLRVAWQRLAKTRKGMDPQAPMPMLALLLAESGSAPGTWTGTAARLAELARAALKVGAKAVIHAPAASVLSSGAGLVLAGALVGVSIATVASSESAAPAMTAMGGTSPGRSSQDLEPPPVDDGVVASAVDGSSQVDLATSGDPSAATCGDPSGATSGDPSRATSGDPSRAASGDPSRATSGNPSRAASGHPSRATSGHRTRAKPSQDFALRYETAQILEANTALARGDATAAQKALEAHAQAFLTGKLAGEREILYARLLLAEGRRNEAIERARRFLASNPRSHARAQIEAMLGPIH